MVHLLSDALQDFVNVHCSQGRSDKIGTSALDVLILPADLLLNCIDWKSQV